MEKGANVNADNDKHQTPLGSGNKEVIEYHIEHGAKTNAKDNKKII